MRERPPNERRLRPRQEPPAYEITGEGIVVGDTFEELTGWTALRENPPPIT